MVFVLKRCSFLPLIGMVWILNPAVSLVYQLLDKEAFCWLELACLGGLFPSSLTLTTEHLEGRTGVSSPERGSPGAPQLRMCVMSQTVWESLTGLGPLGGLTFPSSLESEEFWVERDDLLSPVPVLSMTAQGKGGFGACDTLMGAGEDRLIIL
jgi:hypothetical protein